jgi:uncharacterized protein YqgV (UPF0045/DUF77 family)
VFNITMDKGLRRVFTIIKIDNKKDEVTIEEKVGKYRK